MLHHHLADHCPCASRALAVPTALSGWAISDKPISVFPVFTDCLKSLIGSQYLILRLLLARPPGLKLIDISGHFSANNPRFHLNPSITWTFKAI